MRKRPSLLAGLATAIAAAVAASAAIAGPTVVGQDGNTQSIDVKVLPKKLPKRSFAPATLEVTTKTTSTTAPNGVPSPARRALVDFDRNARLFTRGLPSCNPGRVQSVSTEQARSACGKAEIGRGNASVLLPIGEKVFTEPAVVTAFNGPRQGGKPTVLLHTYGVAPVQTVLVLSGPISNYNKQGFGPRLDLAIPKIAGGSGALTDFHVRIKKTWRFKGKKRSFVSAKCPNSKKLKARGAFTFADGETLTAISVRPCIQKR